MDKFLNKRYKGCGYENYDELLMYLGKNFIERKLAFSISPIQYITLNEDGTYSLYFSSSLVKYKLTFRLGVEFEEIKPDGVKVKSTIVFEGSNKMIHTQREEISGKTLIHVYEFYPDKMIISTTANGLKCVVKRFYMLVQ